MRKPPWTRLIKTFLLSWSATSDMILFVLLMHVYQSLNILVGIARKPSDEWPGIYSTTVTLMAISDSTKRYLISFTVDVCTRDVVMLTLFPKEGFTTNDWLTPAIGDVSCTVALSNETMLISSFVMLPYSSGKVKINSVPKQPAINKLEVNCNVFYEEVSVWRTWH